VGDSEEDGVVVEGPAEEEGQHRSLLPDIPVDAGSARTIYWALPRTTKRLRREPDAVP